LRLVEGLAAGVVAPMGLVNGVAWRSCVLRPGDALLLPARWWHWVHAMETPPTLGRTSDASDGAAVLSVNWWLDKPTRSAPST